MGALWPTGQLLCWQMNGLAPSHLVTTCQFSTYGSYMLHTTFHTKGKWKKILLSVIRDEEKCKHPRRPRHISASGDLLHLLRQRHEIWVYKMSWEIMVTYEIKDFFFFHLRRMVLWVWWWMLFFNSLFYYPLITEQVGCEIALRASSVWLLYF